MDLNIYIQLVFLCVVNVRTFCFFWDRFEHIGNNQFLEIIPASKEIM